MFTYPVKICIYLDAKYTNTGPLNDLLISILKKLLGGHSSGTFTRPLKLPNHW